MYVCQLSNEIRNVYGKYNVLRWQNARGGFMFYKFFFLSLSVLIKGQFLVQWAYELNLTAYFRDKLIFANITAHIWCGTGGK